MKRSTFCERMGSTGRKTKEYEAMMENISSTMVLKKHVDGMDTRSSTTAVPFVNNPMVNFLGVTIIGAYQEYLV